MKKVLLFFALAVLCAGAAFGQKKTFIRDYLYQASERDSKITAREAAMQQMQVLLLKEIGQVIQSEEALRKQSVLKDGKETFSESFSQEVMAITAGFVEMKILDESWNGKTYYIEAKMTVDPKEVSQRVAKVLDDRQKERELAAAQQKEEKAQTVPISPCNVVVAKLDLNGNYEWKNAYTACVSAGWRLPTFEELKCICENSDAFGVFNSNGAFGNYWSSTTVEGKKNKVYVVNFKKCKDYTAGRESGSFASTFLVRCVRDAK